MADISAIDVSTERTFHASTKRRLPLLPLMLGLLDVSEMHGIAAYQVLRRL
jgi:hypothetical protein